MEHESEGGAQYYTDAATDGEARILTDDAVDSISSSFMSSSACSIDKSMHQQHCHLHENTDAAAGCSNSGLVCDRITIASDHEDGALASRVQLRPLNIPHMRILLIAVGTR